MEIMVYRKQEKRSVFKGISLKNNKEKITPDAGTVSNFQAAFSDSTSLINPYFSFEIPSRYSHNAVVFSLQFEVKNNLLTRKFQVVLNPVMNDSVEEGMTIKHFVLDDKGFYKFENEVFTHYYLKGSIQFPLDKSMETEIAGNINISYGKINEGLNFIIGTVSLLKQEDEVRFRNMFQKDTKDESAPKSHPMNQLLKSEIIFNW
jgi:hypothetical protein